MKIYTWTDGSTYSELPSIMDNTSPINEAWWLAHGGTIEEVPDPPEPPPVIRYSKYKIQKATQALGLWEDVKAAIVGAGLADSWANIVDIASDNAELQGALPRIKEIFGADVVEAVLAESIAD